MQSWTLKEASSIFLNKKVAKDAPIAVYVAPVFRYGDPRISADNSYQMMIPGTNLVMDAAGIDESVGKEHFLNDSMDFSTAEVKLRQAPGGLHYCIAYALDEYPRNHEMETTYGRDFSVRSIQWEKLSEKDKISASNNYKILAPDMLM